MIDIAQPVNFTIVAVTIAGLLTLVAVGIGMVMLAKKKMLKGDK